MTRLILIKDSGPLVEVPIEIPDLDQQLISDRDGIVTFDRPVLTEMVVRVFDNGRWVTREIQPNTTGGLIVVNLSERVATSEFDFGRRFTVVRIIGRGGMGIVVEAVDEELKRRVAIKTLSRQLLDIPEAREVFRKEGQAIAKLDHKNLVKVHDVTHSGENPIMVLEFIDGENVDSMIARSGALPIEDVRRLGIQVCDAMAYLHAAGIIHRDLKPANMMVRGDGRLKLVDFGLARSLEQLYEKGTNVRGTPAYMAPEQLKGDPLSESTDIYQFGVCLFEMLTGELPYPAGSMGYAQLHAETPRVSERDETIDDALSELVYRCMAKDPAKRPRDATEVLLALGRPSDTPSSERDVEAGRPSPRSRWIVTTMLALATVAALAIFVATQPRTEPAVTASDDEALARTTGEPAPISEPVRGVVSIAAARLTSSRIVASNVVSRSEAEQTPPILERSKPEQKPVKKRKVGIKKIAVVAERSDIESVVAPDLEREPEIHSDLQSEKERPVMIPKFKPKVVTTEKKPAKKRPSRKTKPVKRRKTEETKTEPQIPDSF